jgi:hypothetical protein
MLDQVIVLGNKHLRKILRRDFDDYPKSQTHWSLAQDAPSTRRVQPIGIGGAVARSPLPHHRTYGAVYGGSVT